MALFKYFKTIDKPRRTDKNDEILLHPVKSPLSLDITNKSMLYESKRGQYLKFSQEEKATIGKFASQHSVAKAAKEFKNKGVKESTIRGWRRLYEEELHNKSENGEETVITALPNKKRGRPSIIKKLESNDTTQHVESNSVENVTQVLTRTYSTNTDSIDKVNGRSQKRGHYHKFSQEEKAVIGKFASEHGVGKAVKEFKNKGVKDSTIRGWRRLSKEELHNKSENETYRETVIRPLPSKKRNKPSNNDVTTVQQTGTSTNNSVTTEVSSPISALYTGDDSNKVSGVIEHTQYQRLSQQEKAAIRSEHSVRKSVEEFNDEGVKDNDSIVGRWMRLCGKELHGDNLNLVEETDISMTTTQELMNSTCSNASIDVNSPVSNDSNPIPSPSYPDADCDNDQQSTSSTCNSVTEVGQIPNAVESSSSTCSLEEGKAGNMKRGRYHRFFQEEKAAIGKFASEHSVAKAVKKFKNKGVKDSTIRGWRRLYEEELHNKSENDRETAITSLPSKKRGRPSIIKKLDTTQLIESSSCVTGVSASLAVTDDKVNRKRRGQYLRISQEEKAAIGKFASEHSVTKAVRKFNDKGVKESTIRGWRRLYEEELHSMSGAASFSEEVVVSSLPSKKRGRPPVLGKNLDEMLQEIILSFMVDQQTVITSSVVIDIVRALLLRFDKSSLSDFGGPINPNKKWAHYILRRMGISKKKAKFENSQ